VSSEIGGSLALVPLKGSNDDRGHLRTMTTR
jgi:hypothetical protein